MSASSVPSSTIVSVAVDTPPVPDPQLLAVPFDTTVGMVAVAPPPVLPTTGSMSSIGVVGLVVLVAGVLALMVSRRKFSRRPPRRCVKSPGDAHSCGALVEASVPVESRDPPRSLLLPVREVSLHTVPCDGVLEGDAHPSRVLPSSTMNVGGLSRISVFAALGEEFAAAWDCEDEADWCSPFGIPRPRRRLGLVR